MKHRRKSTFLSSVSAAIYDMSTKIRTQAEWILVWLQNPIPDARVVGTDSAPEHEPDERTK